MKVGNMGGINVKVLFLGNVEIMNRIFFVNSLSYKSGFLRHPGWILTKPLKWMISHVSRWFSCWLQSFERYWLLWQFFLYLLWYIITPPPPPHALQQLHYSLSSITQGGECLLHLMGSSIMSTWNDWFRKFMRKVGGEKRTVAWVSQI